MPLYSDLSLFGAPSSSSYSGLYSPGPYSNHSSLLGSTYRSPVYIKTLPRTFPRSYAPHLATISESQIISPIRRKFSPKLLLDHHGSAKFVAPKPIKINTADIDVSVNKYRKYDRKRDAGEVKVTPEKSPSPSRPEVRVEEEEEQTAKPIRRDRALVRLHTVHKKDSPRRNLQNGDAPKSWRHNFYPSEPKQGDKKPRRSPGELLMDKFLIRTKEEEERFRLEGKKLPRRASVKPKSSTFHDICRQISSENISENLNPGQPEEVTRRQSKSSEEIMKDIRRNSTEILKENVLMLEEMLKDEHLIKEEDENNNTSRGSVKRKKKAAKKKSNEMLVLPEGQQLHRRATQKKIKRTSTDTSIPEDEEAYQMAIRDTTSQVEVEAIRAKPKFTATVEVEHSPSPPGLKAVVDEVEIVESPKVRKPGKFKFNVTIEGIEKKRYDDGQVDLPESQLKVLDSAMAMKREKSRSPAPKEGDVVSHKTQTATSKDVPGKLDIKSTSTEKTQKIKSKSEVPGSKSATETANLVSPKTTDNKTLPATPTNAAELKGGTTNTEVLPIIGKSEPTTPSSQPDDAVATKSNTTKVKMLSDKEKIGTSSPKLTGEPKLGPTKASMLPVDDKTRPTTPPSPPGATPATKMTTTKVLPLEGKSRPSTPTTPPGTAESSKLNSSATQVDNSEAAANEATKQFSSKTAALPIDNKSVPLSSTGTAATTKVEATTTKVLPEKDKIKPISPPGFAEPSKSSFSTTQANKSELTSPTMSETTKTTGDKNEPTLPTSPLEDASKRALPKGGPSSDKSKQSDSNKRGLPRIAEMDEKSSPKFLKSPQTKTASKLDTETPASPGKDRKLAKITPKLPPKEENSSGEDFWRNINTRESVYWDARKRKHQEKRYATYIEEDEEEVEVPQSKVSNLDRKTDVANILKVQEETDRRIGSPKFGKKEEQVAKIGTSEDLVSASVDSPKNKVVGDFKEEVTAAKDLSPKLDSPKTVVDKRRSKEAIKIPPPTSKENDVNIDSRKEALKTNDLQDTSKVLSPKSKDKGTTKPDSPKTAVTLTEKLQNDKGQETSKVSSPTLTLKGKNIFTLDSPKAESPKEKPDKEQEISKVLASEPKSEPITIKPGSPKAEEPAQGDRGKEAEVTSKLKSQTSKEKDKSLAPNPETKEKEMMVETGVEAKQTKVDSKVLLGDEKIAKVLEPKQTGVGAGQGMKPQLPNKVSPEGKVENKVGLAGKGEVKKDVVGSPTMDSPKAGRKCEMVVKDETVLKPGKIETLVKADKATKDAKDETSSVQSEAKKGKPGKTNETKPSTPPSSPTVKLGPKSKDLEATPKSVEADTKLKSQVGSPQPNKKLFAEAKPKKQKINEVKKTDPLQSIVTDVQKQPLKAEVAQSEEEDAAAKKKIVSKRSLVNKSLKDDPDLKEFIVPEEPPPSPQAQKQPDPPSTPAFVPLQSNRLSQFMKPFKKPEQYEQCPVEIYARPKTIRGRHYPKPYAPEPKKEESESEEEEDEDEEEEEEDEEEEEEEEAESTDGETESEESSDDDEDSVDYEAMNDVWGYGKVGASTSSDDSGFDSSSLDNRKNKGCSERDSPTSNPAHNPAFALDPAELAEEFSQSTTFAGFQKSGRITPPATTIPRFRKYNVDDFNFLKVLGKGSFGKVLLAELKDTEYYYAIKCLKKDVVLEDDDVECTLIERKVLALGTKHPYLCHLLCTFQTESHLFFVMEYLNGGDLMFHIQLSGRFSEPRARFYAAEIVSGLKFLHSKGIVYRDLKLDNILLDFDGHVRIADFGMCKLQIFLDRTADTFCGTPDYMAPEIIKGQHYNQNVDWWSFGVLLYEMLIGQSPFSGCDEDELFWSICNERPVLPRFLSKEASSILTLFLEKDASKRLGNKFCQAGDIQDQPFFHPIAWDLLNLRQLEPPFKPNLQHPLDTQYFDRTFTVEKAKITPIDKNILQSMDQTQFQGFSYTNPNATDR